MTSFSDAEEIGLECLALVLVEGPLATDLAFLGSGHPALCCLGEDAPELLLSQSMWSAIIAITAVSDCLAKNSQAAINSLKNDLTLIKDAEVLTAQSSTQNSTKLASRLVSRRQAAKQQQ